MNNIYLEVIPGSRVEIQNDEITARLHVVRDQGPVLVGTGLVLYHEVNHGTTSVLIGSVTKFNLNAR